jgi:hypothetical protein
MMTTVDEMIKEIKQEINNGMEIDEIRDISGEYVDGYVPVYNDRIIKEWQEMPGDYDNRGSAELGHLGQEINIINLMQLDLYIYYGELFDQALSDVESELGVSA